MSTTIPLKLDPQTYEQALNCVHCGLCLPACPTYTQTGHEAESPRGRIQLIRGLHEGTIEPTDSVRHHLDLCLDCRACETACPSGVQYHDLIESIRPQLAASQSTTLKQRVMKWFFLNILVYPERLKLALLPARFLQETGLHQILPESMRRMIEMLPRSTGYQPVSVPDHGLVARATVGFFSGCVGSVLFDDVNQKAIDFIRACGANVRVVEGQVCCGAIHQHNNADPRHFARKNIDAFEGCKYIVNTIAGCGAMLKEYGHLLRDDPGYADRAKAFSKKVRDITEILVHLELPEMKHPIHETITYHDACHLAHAQKVTSAPRKLLAKIPGLTIIPLPESDMCCGAAGTYNLVQPEMAAELAERKLQNIEATGATLCVTGNAGCTMQIQSHAGLRGQPLKVVHPVELLHRSLFGVR